MADAEYGEIVSTKDATLLQDRMLPGAKEDEETNGISAVGNALWSYQHEQRINGIKVDNADAGLPIDREDLLSAAFRLQSVPKSLMMWMSPDDPEALRKYDELLERVYDGTVILQDELKQYDAAKGKFLVWIRYNEVSYALHPRFQYLHEELK